MKIRIDSLRPIRIARLADAEVDHVVFDISPWREAYPALTNYRVEVTSPGGIVYFPAKLVLDGNDFVWTITAEDTASAGDGLYQIVAAGTSGEHKTSAFAAFTVRATMPGTAEDTPPDPAKPWVDKVVEAAQRVEDATVHPPIIGANGNWLLWDFEASAYVDSGKPSQGSGSGGGGIAQETDPTVPAWAKQSNPPTYTAQDVGARSADWLPTPGEIGAQPAGNYALKSEIPAVPVQSVNGKTGAVELTAEDVGAASKESVDRLNEEIVDLKSKVDFADFALLGRTPQTLETDGRVKLVTPDMAEYQILSPTVADFARGELTFTSCEMTTENGEYKIKLTNDISAFYQAYVEWNVAGLTPGETYRLYLECTEDKAQPSPISIFPKDSSTPVLGSYSASNSIWGDINTSFAEFTTTSDTVRVRIYIVNASRDGNDSTKWLENSVNRFKNLYINRADVGSVHTKIIDISGIVSGSAVFENIPAGVTIFSTPECDVYYAEPKAEEIIPISRHHGKTCVCFGDSITGNMSAPNDYPTVLANETGMIVINGGFGGCRMGRHPVESYDAFSMYRLADAVASGDWTLQQAQIDNITSSNRHGHLDALMGVDWSEVDFITIAYGTNDITGGNSIDNESNPKDTTTFIGALCYSIETILTAYPHIKMLLLTPTYRYWIDENNIDSDAKLFNGKAYTDWGDAMLEAAKDYKIPAVDMYRTLGFNALTRGYYFPATDGTHPNANGQKVIGGKVAARLLAEY